MSTKLDLLYKAHWGGAPGVPALVVSESKFVTCTGQRISCYNMDGHASVLLQHNSDILMVHSIYLSPNTYNVVASVKLKGDDVDMIASALYYDIASVFASPSRPKVFQFSAAQYIGKSLQVSREVFFSCLCFSADSNLVAGALNIDSCGIILFDPLKGDLLRVISIVGTINQVSVSPYNSSKYCVTGNDGVFQYFRVSQKTCNAAPILNLSKKNPHYSSHIWINENRVVAGTTTGSITIVHQCDHLHTVDNVFGSSSVDTSADRDQSDDVHNKYVDQFNDSVNCLLNKGDYIFAASGSQCIAIFEIKHSSASGNSGASATIVPLIRYYFTDISSIVRMDWKQPKTMQSYIIYLTGNGVVLQYDLRKFDFTNIIIGTDNWGKIIQHKIDCIELKAEKTIFSYHIGSITNINLSSRTSTLMSVSSEDGIVMAKDVQFNAGAGQLKDCFIDRKEEIPIHATLHPNGLFVTSATESYIREYAITDAKLEPSKLIPVKAHWHANNGHAVSNLTAPSLVKYSHGGQFLAVVTGKIVQIFHMYNLDYNNSDTNGVPTRIMTAMDHTTVITDLAFSHDDAFFITTDISGCVYSWPVGNTSLRSGDFVMKGAISLKVAINSCALGKQPTIAVIYNSHIDPSTISRRNVQRLKSKTQNAISNRSAIVSLSDIDKTTTSSSSSSKNCIMFWKGVLTFQPVVINLDVPPTSVALGWSQAQTEEICAIGLSDGRVLVSAMPLPLMIISVAVAPGPFLPFSTGGASGILEKDPNHDNASAALTVGGASASQSAANVNNVGQPPPAVVNNAEKFEVLDESKCSKMHLHSGRVSCTVISPSGLWLFSAGIDGAVFMLALSSSANHLLEIPEVANALENNIVVCEKQQLQLLRSKVVEADSIIEDTRKECDRMIGKMQESKSATVSELEGRMKRELAKRDEIIVRGRSDFTRMVKQLKDEINKIRTKNKAETAQLEYMYEKKLAHEAVYLDRMRQAYDEFVVHARHNLADANREYEKKLEQIELTKLETVQETEKQKKALLLYVDFMNNQHKLLYDSLEERQADERVKLKEEISTAEKNKENVETKSRVKIVKLHTETHRLKEKMQSTEDESLKLQADLDWARGRIDRLESSLQQSTTELKKKNDLCSTWEFKVGEMGQQVTELERIRKVLTLQLHSVREEMAPKEEKLTQVSDKLNTTENEYFSSLHAITDKENQLRDKSETLNLLKKQLGELRRQSLYKESLLKRVAKIFEDYKWALRQAQYSSHKKPMTITTDRGDPTSGALAMTNDDPNALNSSDSSSNNNNNNNNANNSSNNISATIDSIITKKKKPDKENQVVMVEVISRTEAMEKPLKELDSLLKNFSKIDQKYETELASEAELVQQEQERHHLALQSGIQTLTNTMINAEKVAENKVYVHLKDNQKLLEEVNFLRHELRGMSMENQRLIASSDHVERQNKKLHEKISKMQALNHVIAATSYKTTNIGDGQGKATMMKLGKGLDKEPSITSLHSQSLGSKYSRQDSPPDSPDPDKIIYDEENSIGSANPELIIGAIMNDVKNDASVGSDKKAISDSIGGDAYANKGKPVAAALAAEVASVPVHVRPSTSGSAMDAASSTRNGSGSPSRLLDFRASSPPRDKRPILSKSESQPLPVNKNCFEDFFQDKQLEKSGGKTMSLADEKILALMAQNESEIRRKRESDSRKIAMPLVMHRSIAESEVSGGSAAEILRQYQTIYTGGPQFASEEGGSFGGKGLIPFGDEITFPAQLKDAAPSIPSIRRPTTSGAISSSKSSSSLKFESAAPILAKTGTNPNRTSSQFNNSLPPKNGSGKR